jgi:hypothetical protein
MKNNPTMSLKHPIASIAELDLLLGPLMEIVAVELVGWQAARS